MAFMGTIMNALWEGKGKGQVVLDGRRAVAKALRQTSRTGASGAVQGDRPPSA